MHEFYGRKFLCPDKKQLNAKEAKKTMFGGHDMDMNVAAGGAEETKGGAKKGANVKRR